MPITFENSHDNLMINKYLGPFAVTYLRYQVVDFSSYFYMDASPFMTSFETQVDIYALIRPFNYDILWRISTGCGRTFNQTRIFGGFT